MRFLPSSWLEIAPAVVLLGVALPPGLWPSSLARIWAMPPPSAPRLSWSSPNDCWLSKGTTAKLDCWASSVTGPSASASRVNGRRVMATRELEMENETVVRGQDLESRGTPRRQFPG